MFISKEAIKAGLKDMDYLGNPVHRPLREALEQMLKAMEHDNRDGLNLIDRDSYIATVLWQEEDIKSVLEDRGFPTDEETVTEVLNHLSISQLEDCSDGFDVIHAAVDEYARANSLPRFMS